VNTSSNARGRDWEEIKEKTLQKKLKGGVLGLQKLTGGGKKNCLSGSEGRGQRTGVLGCKCHRRGEERRRKKEKPKRQGARNKEERTGHSGK